MKLLIWASHFRPMCCLFKRCSLTFLVDYVLLWTRGIGFLSVIYFIENIFVKNKFIGHHMQLENRSIRQWTMQCNDRAMNDSAFVSMSIETLEWGTIEFLLTLMDQKMGFRCDEVTKIRWFFPMVYFLIVNWYKEWSHLMKWLTLTCAANGCSAVVIVSQESKSERMMDDGLTLGYDRG